MPRSLPTSIQHPGLATPACWGDVDTGGEYLSETIENVTPAAVKVKVLPFRCHVFLRRVPCLPRPPS